MHIIEGKELSPEKIENLIKLLENDPLSCFFLIPSASTLTEIEVQYINSKLKPLVVLSIDEAESLNKEINESTKKLTDTQALDALRKELKLVTFFSELEATLKKFFSKHTSIVQLKISYRTSDSNLSGNKLFRRFDLNKNEFEYGVLDCLFSKEPLAAELNLIKKCVPLIVDILKSLTEIEDLRILEEEWKTTFDAHKEGVAIISQDYEVITSNKKLGSSTSGKCYERFFRLSKPCTGCKLGESFIIESNDKTHSVVSQFSWLGQQRVLINMYRDLTEKKKLEKRLIDVARFAELGTVGSSIAHELNNPIAGILTTLQLLKSMTSPNDPVFADLQVMENGAIRSRDIVKELLNFSRGAETTEWSLISMVDEIDKTLRLMQLMARSSGIVLEFYNATGDLNPKLNSAPSLLSQMLLHLLQIIVPLLQVKDAKAKRVYILLAANSSSYTIDLAAEPGLPSDWTGVKTLGVGLSEQLALRHGGSLEIGNWKEKYGDLELCVQAKLTLPRPVLDL